MKPPEAERKLLLTLVLTCGWTDAAQGDVAAAPLLVV